MTDWTTAHIEGAPRIAVDYMGSGPNSFTAVAWAQRGWGDSDDYD